MDHYKFLRINTNATQKEIESAYRKLIKEGCHPDKHQTDGKLDEATLFFKLIREAYETLIDPHKRKTYDALSEKDKDDMYKKHYKNNNSVTPDSPARNGQNHSPHSSPNVSSNASSKGSKSNDFKAKDDKKNYFSGKTMSDEEINALCEEVEAEDKAANDKRKRQNIERERQAELQRKQAQEEEAKRMEIRAQQLEEERKQREQEQLKAAEEERKFMAERAKKLRSHENKISDEYGLNCLLDMLIKIREDINIPQDLVNNLTSKFAQLQQDINEFCKQLAIMFVDNKIDKLPNDMKRWLSDIRYNGLELKQSYESIKTSHFTNDNINSEHEKRKIENKLESAAKRLITLIDKSNGKMPEFGEVKDAIINFYQNDHYVLKMVTGVSRYGYGVSPNYSYYWSFFYPQERTTESQPDEQQLRRREIINKVLADYLQQPDFDISQLAAVRAASYDSPNTMSSLRS